VFETWFQSVVPPVPNVANSHLEKAVVAMLVLESDLDCVVEETALPPMLKDAAVPDAARTYEV